MTTPRRVGRSRTGFVAFLGQKVLEGGQQERSKPATLWVSVCQKVPIQQAFKERLSQITRGKHRREAEARRIWRASKAESDSIEPRRPAANTMLPPEPVNHLLKAFS